MNFLAILLGAAIGVIAGTFVQYGVARLANRDRATQQKKALRKEMEYDLSLLKELKAEISRLRNAVNGHTLPTYLPLFRNGDAFFLQTKSLIDSGELYHWLSVETLRRLQRTTSILSVSSAAWILQEIEKHKKLFGTPQFKQTDAVAFVDFIEKQIMDAEANLQEIIAVTQH